eukprot:845473-Amphidinium_carterae.1
MTRDHEHVWAWRPKESSSWPQICMPVPLRCWHGACAPAAGRPRRTRSPGGRPRAEPAAGQRLRYVTNHSIVLEERPAQGVRSICNCTSEFSSQVFVICGCETVLQAADGSSVMRWAKICKDCGGGHRPEVLALYKQAVRAMGCVWRKEVRPRPPHLAGRVATRHCSEEIEACCVS